MDRAIRPSHAEKRFPSEGTKEKWEENRRTHNSIYKKGKRGLEKRKAGEYETVFRPLRYHGKKSNATTSCTSSSAILHTTNLLSSFSSLESPPRKKKSPARSACCGV